MKTQYSKYRSLSVFALILSLLAAPSITVRDVTAQPTLSTAGRTFSTMSLTSPGDLDPTFRIGGKVIDGSGNGSYDLAIQPDGKIVSVGIALGGSEGTEIAVTRYNIDGSPDTTFGGTGRVLIDRYGVGMDVAIQPDGKIVVASRNNDGEVDGELLRLNPDGSLDRSFGTNGIVAQLFLPSVPAILPDGKILIAQAADVYRLNADGSFDITFSPCKPGVSTVHYLYNRIEGVIQPDGKILTVFTPGAGGFGAFRCSTNGALDNTFGSGGVVITRKGLSLAQSIALQADGKVILAGQSQTSDWKLTLARYNPNGSLDTTFGTGGVVTALATHITDWNPPIGSVSVQTDGKIVASDTILNGSADFVLVRVNPNGSPDDTFSDDGISTVNFKNKSDDRANGMALDGRGRAVVVGTSDGAFALARFVLSPPAPAVLVSGCVTTPDGSGLRNAMVSLTDPIGVRRTAITSTLGYYSFDNVAAGQTYSISVQSRRYRFSSNQLQIDTTLTGVDFVAIE
jgi:uncharacterized delta-60 repeat protein